MRDTKLDLIERVLGISCTAMNKFIPSNASTILNGYTLKLHVCPRDCLTRNDTGEREWFSQIFSLKRTRSMISNPFVFGSNDSLFLWYTLRKQTLRNQSFMVKTTEDMGAFRAKNPSTHISIVIVSLLLSKFSCWLEGFRSARYAALIILPYSQHCVFVSLWSAFISML